MDDDKLTGAQKRRIYIMAFAVAFFIDLFISTVRGEVYKPSLLGLAIMIASVLYFIYSKIRER